MSSAYLPFDQLMRLVDEPYRTPFLRLLAEHGELFRAARGSSHNHQAWPGGYADHVRETMNIAVVLYEALRPLRPVPFSLSDTLVVMFVHDLEKPWAYELGPEGWRRREGLKENAHAFRLARLAEASLTLPEELERTVTFVEGEGGKYSNPERGMSPLAAFCHMCDVASARLWHDYPLERDDPWEGDGRGRA
jgi:hypothetical protein